MIKTAFVGRYRLQEFIQFVSNTLAIVKQHGPDKLRIRAQYLTLLQQYERLQQAYQQNALSEITPQLARLDARRDRAIVCLRKLCDGYACHPNERLKAAGKKIVACIDKYGSKLYHLNYSAETAALKNLVRELQTNPECLSAIQEMKLEEVVKEMEAANLTFDKLFIQRLGEFSQSETNSTRALMPLTTEAYRTLAQHVDAHATLTPSEEYTSLINHLNENIEHFNLIVERRKGGIEAEDADVVVDTPQAPH